MAAGALCALRPPPVEKDEEEMDPLMLQIWRAASEAAVTRRVYEGGWIIDALFKRLLRDVIEPESPSWKKNARCQLAPLKLTCHFTAAWVTF